MQLNKRKRSDMYDYSGNLTRLSNGMPVALATSETLDTVMSLNEFEDIGKLALERRDLFCGSPHWIPRGCVCNPVLISYLSDTDSLTLALLENPYALQFVAVQSAELVEVAVKHDGASIQYAAEHLKNINTAQGLELWKLAITHTPSSIQYLKNPPQAIIDLAIVEDKSLLRDYDASPELVRRIFEEADKNGMSDLITSIRADLDDKLIETVITRFPMHASLLKRITPLAFEHIINNRLNVDEVPALFNKVSPKPNNDKLLGWGLIAPFILKDKSVTYTKNDCHAMLTKRPDLLTILKEECIADKDIEWAYTQNLDRVDKLCNMNYFKKDGYAKAIELLCDRNLVKSQSIPILPTEAYVKIIERKPELLGVYARSLECNKFDFSLLSKQAVLTAIEHTPNILNYFASDETLQERVVQLSSRGLSYCANPPETIKALSVAKYPLSIEYIKEPSDRLIRMALSNDLEAFYKLPRKVQEEYHSPKALLDELDNRAVRKGKYTNGVEL